VFVVFKHFFELWLVLEACRGWVETYCTYAGGWEDNFCISHTHTQMYIAIYLYIPIYILSSYPPVYIVIRPKGDRRMSKTNPPASSTTSSDPPPDRWKYFPGHS